MTDLDASTAARSYRPGTWYGVLGDRASVLLPPSERSRVAALWDIVDSGAGFDVVLDALLVGGLSELSGFVLWSSTDGLTQAVARGPVQMRLTTADGDVVLDGTEAATWAERRVSGVRSTTVEVEEVAGPDLGVVGGLVRVGRVDEPAYSMVEDLGPLDAAGSPGVVDSDEADESFETDEDIEALDPVASEDVSGLEGAPESDLAPEPEPEPVVEPEPVEAVAAQLGDPLSDPLTDPLSDPLDDPAEEESDEDVTEVFAPTWSQTAPPVPSGAPPLGPPAAPPGSPGWPAHDGGTRSGYDPGRDAPIPPGIPGQPQPPAVTSRPVARLVLSHGETVDVDRAVLVGRAPEARRYGAGEQPRLVSVLSPHQEISSTHLEIRPGSGADHGSAVITDLGSTNGTVLVQPGLPPESLQPGIAVQLIPGAIVDLGDGVTIQVTNP